jgi:hypothetical protein
MMLISDVITAAGENDGFMSNSLQHTREREINYVKLPSRLIANCQNCFVKIENWICTDNELFRGDHEQQCIATQT